MKKLFVFLICIQLINIPAFASDLFEDALVNKTLTGKTFKSIKSSSEFINDTFVEKSLKNMPCNSKSDNKMFEDELVNKNLSGTKYQIQKQENICINDTLADKTLKNVSAKPKKAKLNFDFEVVKQTPVKIAITNNITSKKDLTEGQELNFRVVDDVSIDNNLVLKKDALVTAKLETISLNQAFGVPADILIDDFKIVSNQTEINLDGSIHKIGANRSLWVYPVGYMGCFFFGAGLLLFPIRGGHAKIRTKDVYQVYYVPKEKV